MNSYKYNMEMIEKLMNNFDNENGIFEDERIHRFLCDQRFFLNNGYYIKSYFNNQLEENIYIYVKPYIGNSMSVKIQTYSKSCTYEQVHSYDLDTYANIDCNDIISDMLLKDVLDFIKIYREKEDKGE